MKKYLILVLTLGLCGCGGSANNHTDDTIQPEPNPEPATPQTEVLLEPFSFDFANVFKDADLNDCAYNGLSLGAKVTSNTPTLKTGGVFIQQTNQNYYTSINGYYSVSPSTTRITTSARLGKYYNNTL